MAVTFIRGLVSAVDRQSPAGTSDQTTNSSHRNAIETTTQSHVAIYSIADTEATVTNVKTAARANASADRVRDPEFAKKIADTVANRLRDEEVDATELHNGLTPVHTRQHVA